MWSLDMENWGSLPSACALEKQVGRGGLRTQCRVVCGFASGIPKASIAGRQAFHLAVSGGKNTSIASVSKRVRMTGGTSGVHCISL